MKKNFFHLKLLVTFLFLLSHFYAMTQSMFTQYFPCSFRIRLPSTWLVLPVDKEHHPDYCDYLVKSQDGAEIMRMHALTKGRFQYETLKESYEASLKEMPVDITYKSFHENWFVISGIHKKTGHVIYWRSFMGEHFVIDLILDYHPGRRKDIDDFIPEIMKSFYSK